MLSACLSKNTFSRNFSIPSCFIFSIMVSIKFGKLILAVSIFPFLIDSNIFSLSFFAYLYYILFVGITCFYFKSVSRFCR
jgi:hypothetical protein